MSELVELARLIPHQGTMCLLERVVEWDDAKIKLETHTHRAANNPLRSSGRLRAIHLCEYGAQAMAVHGALRSQGSDERPKPGMLVSLRNVQLHCDEVQQLEDQLIVEAVCLQATADSLQYTFRVTHRDQLLAEGRAMVVLGKN
jgi:predicted hotdog family 3-hydroxylacyl-ACP dehydratase